MTAPQSPGSEVSSATSRSLSLASPDDLDSLANSEINPPSISSSSISSLQSLATSPEYTPIAICGIGCRLPGGVSSPSELWNLLIEKKSGHGPVPKRAFNTDGFYHPDPSRPGSVPFKGSYFIQEDVHHFDAGFFGINNLEAAYMDPQQRKLLEVVYESLENAGQTLDAISGAKIGCYIGKSANDWELMQYKGADYASHLTATGSAPAIIANRISYVFNLCGPSLTVDTACSSSVHSLHMACSALGRRECTAAVVASANLIQTPEETVRAVKAGILSADGVCHTFDESANGYGRGEAVSSLYVKRLDDAVRDGDPIRGVIRATAINANGKTTGISMPDSAQQQEAVKDAYARAGLDPKDTQYVEAHGTGTSVGDPIEVDGLVKVMRPKSIEDVERLYIGSVKTNLGHSEGSSALTSIIKVVLALEHGKLPPSFGIKHLNPSLKPYLNRAEIVTEVMPWPRSSSGTMRAGVNSFGFGGANGHVIIEDSHALYRDRKSAVSLSSSSAPKMYLLPVSAKTCSSCEALRRNIRSYLKEASTPAMNVAKTLVCKRQAFSHRSYLLYDGTNLPRDCFDSDNGVVSTLPSNTFATPRSYTFVFTGQGAQWAGMGQGLMEQFPIFRGTISKLDGFLRDLKDAPAWSFSELLGSANHPWKIDEAAIAQPLCTALQIGLIDLLRDWGVRPGAVIGHSSGEIAAAYCTGAIDAQQALATAFYRGNAVSMCSTPGSMAAIGQGPEEVACEIAKAGLADKVKVACINSPISVTVSGDSDGVDTLLAKLETKSVFSSVLRTNGKAYHSHHMMSIGDRYEKSLRDVFRASSAGQSGLSQQAQMYSSVTSSKINPSDLMNSAYWRQNLESPVQFAPAVQYLAREVSDTLFVEVGPHSVLEKPLKQTLTSNAGSGPPPKYFSTLSRKTSPVRALLTLAGDLFTNGQKLELDRIVDLSSSVAATDLPPYVWDHSNTLPLKEPRVSRELRERKYGRHALLGTRIPGSSSIVATWQNILHRRDIPWLEDYTIDAIPVLPIGVYVAIATEALRQYLGTNTTNRHQVCVRNLEINSQPLLSSLDEGLELVTDLQPTRISTAHRSERFFEFEVHSISVNGGSIVCANGQVSLSEAESPAEILWGDGDHLSDSLDGNLWYRDLNRRGFFMGESFQNVQSFCRRKTNTSDSPTMASARFHRKDSSLETAGRNDGLSIVQVVDVISQTALFCASDGPPNRFQRRVPRSIRELHLHLRALEARDGTVQSIVGGPKLPRALYSSVVVDFNGHMLAAADQMKLNTVPYTAANRSTTHAEDPMLRICWKPDVSFLRSVNANALIDAFSLDEPLLARRDSNVVSKYCRMVDLMVHKYPDSSLLFIREENDETNTRALQAIMRALKPIAGLRRTKALELVAETEDGLVGSTVTDFCASIDINIESFKPVSGTKHLCECRVILTTSPLGWSLFLRRLKGPSIMSPLKARYHLNITADENSKHSRHVEGGDGQDGGSLTYTELCCLPCDDSVVRLAEFVAVQSHNSNSVDADWSLFYVFGTKQSSLDEEILFQLRHSSRFKVTDVPFRDVTSVEASSQSIFLVSCELQRALLFDMTAEDLKRVQFITDSASVILWLTADAFHDCSQPDLAMVAGLARTVMLEQPDLRFLILDLSLHDIRGAFQHTTCQNIFKILERAIEQPRPEFELAQRKGLLWVSRFLPDEAYNSDFRVRHQGGTLSRVLADAGRCELICSEPGSTDGLFFNQISGPSPALKVGYIEVKAKYFGLNETFADTICAKYTERNQLSTSEFSGIVTRVGSDCSVIVPGDIVLVMAPAMLATIVSVPEWACVRLNEYEPWKEMASLPKAFGTAQYALKNVASLSARQSLLVTGASTPTGQACIQIGKIRGANVIAITETELERQDIISTYALDHSKVLVRCIHGMHRRIISASGGAAIDVVIDLFGGDNSRELARCCAMLGHFIRLPMDGVEKHSIVDFSTFANPSVRYTSLDTDDLFRSSADSFHEIWHSVLEEVVHLFRARAIRILKVIRWLDVSDVGKVAELVSSEGQIEKTMLCMDNESSVLRYRPSRYHSTFAAEKTYILIGGLGGLGRSLSKWMVDRGAVKLTFLNRSGLDRQSSRDLVAKLERLGAEITVVRGNIDTRSDVERMIQSVAGPIGGIVHAAMGLDESIFSPMTHKQWLTAVTVKVQGTWHLHRALRSREEELDFFVVMSSNTGSVGTATESNYCAANAFLDSFVRFRRLQGLKAVSVGFGMISEVGYIHENPHIEKILRRKGIHPINEEEMLQMMDIAIARETLNVQQAPDYHKGHILTGLELIGLLAQREQGFEGHFHILDDPRFGILAHNFAVRTEEMRNARAAAATTALNDVTGPSVDATGRTSMGSSFQPSREVLKIALVPGKGAEVIKMVDALEGSDFRSVVHAVVAQKMANLLLVDASTLSEDTNLAHFGIDSMLAAEFRSHITRTLKADVPFTTLLDPTTSIRTLVDLVAFSFGK